MLIKDLIINAASKLEAVSESPRLDAEVLLSHVLGIERLNLIVRFAEELDPGHENAFNSLVERRLRHEPVAYICGSREFFGLNFKVTPAVLIPRPETEMIVEKVLEYAASRPDPIRLLDLGTGSGCIALAIASELKALKRTFGILAADASEEALMVASWNANALDLSHCVGFVKSDWYAAIKSRQIRFDFIVSNPPYINRDLPDLPEDLKYEPPSAL